MRPTAAVGLSGARVGFALVCDPDAMPRIARGEGGADRGVNTNSAPAGVSVSPRRCARGADTNGGASGRRERRAAPAGAGLAQGGCARRRGGIRQAEGPMTRLPPPSALWAPAQPDLSLSGPMQRLAPWGPIIFISNKFPGGTNVDGPVATFKNCYFMKIQNKEGLLLAGEIKKVHEEYSLFSACA